MVWRSRCRNGDISRIVMANNNLTGKLPRNTGDLQALQVLSLEHQSYYRQPTDFAGYDIDTAATQHIVAL